MRILNVTIEEDIKLLHALTKLYGIGFKRSNKIITLLDLQRNKTIKELTIVEKERLKNFLLEKEKTLSIYLKRSISLNIKKELALKTYKGSRYKNKMPVRGQRTRSNNQTNKKKDIFLVVN